MARHRDAAVQRRIDRFIDAAGLGDLDVVREAVNSGVDVDAGNSFSGGTALHRAAFHRREDVVSFLLSRGANPNAKSEDGWTPTYIAAGWSSAAILKAIIAAGGDVNERNNEGMAPLVALVRNCSHRHTTNSSASATATAGATREEHHGPPTAATSSVSDVCCEDDVVERLKVLVSTDGIDLNTKYMDKSASQWAHERGRCCLADVIDAEVSVGCVVCSSLLYCSVIWVSCRAGRLHRVDENGRVPAWRTMSVASGAGLFGVH